MAALIPFRALRPAAPAAARVAAVPYDVVSREEAQALATGNPLSFLHVSRAEIDLPAGTDPYSDAVYTRAQLNFETLKRDAPLVLDDEPSVYIYRLRAGGHEQTGVAACYALDDYDAGRIRKHELTRRDKEDDRTRHMLALRAQTGPVFLTYRAMPGVDALVARTIRTAPVYDFAAPDGVQHILWKAGADEQRGLISAFAAIPALYIADGHHRAASAARARAELRGPQGMTGAWDSFLAVAFPHDQLQVLAYNRTVRDLGGLSAGTFLSHLRQQFRVEEGSARPLRRGDIGMFVDGRWYLLSLGDAPAGLSPVEQLDVSRLQDSVLTPILGIGDVRTDKRIDFVGGARGVETLEQLVRSGAAAVAFSLYPVSVEALMQVCDAGGMMPPKSTWFEPKLRDGLLSHAI